MIKVLLIGCGKFGKNHLRILEEANRVEVVGVVTKSKEAAEKIAKEYNVKTYTENHFELLDEIDAVFIATPASTHFEIAKKCLPKVHVFVEKPLALNEKHIHELMSIKTEKKLMIGHIYRFNNGIEMIKKKISNPSFIEIKTIGGIPPGDCDALHEFCHGFDILDNLLEEQPNEVKIIDYTKDKFVNYAKIELTYSNTTAIIEVGWQDVEKTRTMLIKEGENEILMELVSQDITINGEKIQHELNEPLKSEINRFLDVISGEELYYPNVELALRLEILINKCLMLM